MHDADAIARSMGVSVLFSRHTVRRPPGMSNANLTCNRVCIDAINQFLHLTQLAATLYGVICPND